MEFKHRKKLDNTKNKKCKLNKCVLIRVGYEFKDKNREKLISCIKGLISEKNFYAWANSISKDIQKDYLQFGKLCVSKLIELGLAETPENNTK